MSAWVLAALKWLKDKLFSSSKVENNYGSQARGIVIGSSITCVTGGQSANTIHLSYKERTVLEFFASGGYAVYALDEDGKIEQINLIGENKCADTAETAAINTLAQYGFIEKLIAPPHIVCTPAGHSFVRQGK